MGRLEEQEQYAGATPDFVIVIHSLAHAIAALGAGTQAGRAVVLTSAPDAGGYVGPGWFSSLITEARKAVPEASFSALLDCGDNIGAALAAIRAEVEGVIFTGRPDVARRLADIARQHAVRLVTDRSSPAVDLTADFFANSDLLEQRCAQALRKQVVRKDAG